MARFDADALIEEVVAELSGHSLEQDQFTWLTSPINSSDTTISVADTSKIRRGLAEIGDELVWVAESNTTGVVLAPFGRGAQGSAAQSWPVNTRVTYGPRFPRYRVKHKINDLVRGVFPTIFAVGTHEFTPGSPAFVTYELPADAEDVLTVKQATLGPSRDWRVMQNWRFDRAANTDEFPNGRTLDVWDVITPGQTIHVTYMKRPSPMTSAWSDTGLNDSAWPAVMYGVLHQMIAPQEAAVVGVNAVKAAEAQRRRGHSAAELSREYYAIHQQLLQEERMRLLTAHEITNNSEVF